ncbi:MAG: SGNH/GDSL hydrolase family protein, partial [Clostridia bacterium]|nr:SGNH/GDSL hydrolase family protein [Clostridia bacterium]
MKKDYSNKYFSILGDSISTLDGYNPEGYKLFYTGERRDISGVKKESDTWWGQVIKHFKGKLLVNNSWSGSRASNVSENKGCDDLFPSGCSGERTGSMHSGNIMPDVIIVFMGTNDWKYGIRCRSGHDDEDHIEFRSFDSAYDKILSDLKLNYPNAEIWCCTLGTNDISNDPGYSFPYAISGTHIKHFCDVIKQSAEKHGCNVIDLYGKNVPFDSFDGTHPTKKGMK